VNLWKCDVYFRSVYWILLGGVEMAIVCPSWDSRTLTFLDGECAYAWVL